MALRSLTTTGIAEVMSVLIFHVVETLSLYNALVTNLGVLKPRHVPKILFVLIWHNLFFRSLKLNFPRDDIPKLT